MNLLLTDIEAAADALQNADGTEKISRLQEFFITCWDNFVSFIPTIIISIIILILGIILSKVILRIMSKGMQRGKMEPTIIHFTSSLIKIVLYVIVFTIVLTMLNVPMTSIITVLGGSAVAISLALQNSLSNLAGGFIILFAKPFKIGDFIETNSEQGTVVKISILYTMINTLDNKAVFIPNGSVSGAKVINFSSNETRRVDIDFGISYTNDFRKAIKSIQGVIENDERILKTPEPFVRLSKHADSSLIITTRVWVKNSDYWDVYFALMENVKDVFDANSIEIPFNQLDVHIDNVESIMK